MTIAVVSPMHNEESNVDGLAKSLLAQTYPHVRWIAVDDGSNDATGSLLTELVKAGALTLINKQNDGGLIGGSAFTSWWRGVDVALEDPAVTHVMKLDADVRLDPEYLRIVLSRWKDSTGVSGGTIRTSGMREQNFHVPGPVKIYSRRAVELIRTLPRTIGFDIMDEVLLGDNGLEVVVHQDVQFEMARAIGASEGRIHGRFRNGRGCRWTGYDPTYFAVRCLRYLVRKPYVVGSFAMAWGYLTAGVGPYSSRLRTRHAESQRRKLKRALLHPKRFLHEAYGVDREAVGGG